MFTSIIADVLINGLYLIMGPKPSLDNYFMSLVQKLIEGEQFAIVHFSAVLGFHLGSLLVEAFLAYFSHFNLVKVFSIHESEEILVSDYRHLLLLICFEVLELTFKLIGPLLRVVEALDLQWEAVLHDEVKQMLLVSTTLTLLKNSLKFTLETRLQGLDEPEAVERRVWELRQETCVKFGELDGVFLEGYVDVSGYITTSMKLLPNEWLHNKRNILKIRVVLEQTVSCLHAPPER